MKKIIIFCLAIINALDGYSQIMQDSPGHVNPYNREEAYKKADYVFEGVIIQRSFYMRGKDAIESDIVKVQKVFRGNLVPGTVEIVNYADNASFNSPKLERTFADAAKFRKYKVDTFAFFFCKADTALPYDPQYNIDVVDNKVLLSDYHNYSSKKPYFNRVERWANYGGYHGFAIYGKTKADVYKQLKKYTNLKIPDVAEPEPIDSTIPKHIASGDHFTKHESDSISRVRYPEAFDSTGKFIGYNYYYHINKARKDSTKNAKIDSIRLARYPKAFDSTGKFIGMGYYRGLKKAKLDSINGTDGAIKKKRTIILNLKNEKLEITKQNEATDTNIGKLNVTDKTTLKAAVAANVKSAQETDYADITDILYNAVDYTPGTLPDVAYNGSAVTLDFTLDYGLYDEGVTNEVVSWISDYPSIATIGTVNTDIVNETSDAAIKIIGTGTTDITAKISFDYTVSWTDAYGQHIKRLFQMI